MVGWGKDVPQAQGPMSSSAERHTGRDKPDWKGWAKVQEMKDVNLDGQ